MTNHNTTNHIHADHRSRLARRRESGAALLVVMMVLAMVAAMGISSLQTVMRDRQVAGFQSRKRVAFQAAEAGVAAVRASIAMGNATPSVMLTSLGDAAAYPHGLPTYGPDTSVANPITDMGSTAAAGMNLRIDGNAGPKFQLQLWRLRVEGREASGILSRIESTASQFKGN